ncbi:DUF6471 domain-containing protein [Burkholderia sp. PU8-34]
MAANFQYEARLILRQQMEELGISFQDLCDLLEVTGLRENKSALYRKVEKGTFQFSFFLRCIAAMQGFKDGAKTPPKEVLIRAMPLEKAASPIDEHELHRDGRRRARKKNASAVMSTPTRTKGTQSDGAVANAATAETGERPAKRKRRVAEAA